MYEEFKLERFGDKDCVRIVRRGTPDGKFEIYALIMRYSNGMWAVHGLNDRRVGPFSITANAAYKSWRSSR